MRQEQAFTSAIRDDPDDDLHRLAWADWLDDHGDSRRADFIRAQVRLAGLGEDDPARDALEDEADDLLEGHEQQWAGRVGELALEWTWRRGCVERVTMWADTLLTHGDALFVTAPIRELRLLTETGDTVRLAGCLQLGSVEALDLGHDSAASQLRGAFHRDRALQQLFVSPHLKRLRRVLLRGQGIEGPLLQTLIDTGLFARLEELDLSGNRALGDRAARLLAAQRSNTLATLDVWGTNLTPLGLRHLLQARSWPAMRRLRFNVARLFANGVTESAFRQEWAEQPLAAQLTEFFWGNTPHHGLLTGLLAWEGLPRLEELGLVTCQLDAMAAEAIARCEGLAALRALSVGGNPLRDAGVRALASAPQLSRLAALTLEANDVGGPGIRALTSSPAMANLRQLHLGTNHVGAAGAEALAAGGLRRLRQLTLSDANLDAEAAAALAVSPILAGLRSLELGHNSLGDEGVKALAASPHLRRLETLNLDSCSVGRDGALTLAESPFLNRLKRLGLRNTYVTGRERERLTARFGAAVLF